MLDEYLGAVAPAFMSIILYPRVILVLNGLLKRWLKLLIGNLVIPTNKETTIGLLRGGCCYDCKHCVTDIDPKTDTYFAYCDLKPEIRFPDRKNLPDVIHRSCRKFEKFPMYVEQIKLGEKDWNSLVEHLKNPPPPTQALIDLFKEYGGKNGI